MIYKCGKTWWYKFKFAGRVFRESARTQSKAIARQAERQRHQKLEQAVNGIVERVAPITFRVASDEWMKLKQPTWAAKPHVAEARNLKHLRPVFGSWLLIDIGADDIADYQKSRRKAGASPKTINHEVGALRAILKRHRLWAALQPDVTMMRADTTVGKAITEREEKQLLEACRRSRSRTLLPFVTLALHTGLRKGELASLGWEQIDFLAQTLTVGTPKTAAGTGRVVPLNETAFATLKGWATNFPDRQPGDALFPREHYGLAGNERKHHAKTVDPATQAGDIKSAWATAKRKSGIKCRLHDTRQTFATRVLERGGSLSVVASIMGWSASTTVNMAKRYGHIGAEAQRAAVDALSAPTQAPRWSHAPSASRS